MIVIIVVRQPDEFSYLKCRAFAYRMTKYDINVYGRRVLESMEYTIVQNDDRFIN